MQSGINSSLTLNNFISNFALDKPRPPHLNEPAAFFIGDVRTNEQPGLTAIHALWVREHNRIINQLAQTFAFPENNPEEREVLYQSARRIVIAEYQVKYWF